ncbi:unnamed protein product [Chrysoparadoxa australica]
MSASDKLMLAVLLSKRLWKEGHRTLIFSQSVRILDILQKCLAASEDDDGAGLLVSRIDGGSSDQDRQRTIDEFNKDESIAICLLSTKAGGYGITLTGASRCIMFDPSWNPAEDRQAVDRCYRIGQQKNVIVYRMITAGTVEEKMYEKQVFKDGLRRTVMDRRKQAKVGRYFSRKDLKDLFRLGEPGVCRVLDQLEEKHGAVMDMLKRSEVDFERDLVKEEGHLLYLSTLEGVLGTSLHDCLYLDAKPETKGSQRKSNAMSHVSGLSSGVKTEGKKPYSALKVVDVVDVVDAEDEQDAEDDQEESNEDEAGSSEDDLVDSECEEASDDEEESEAEMEEGFLETYVSSVQKSSGSGVKAFPKPPATQWQVAYNKLLDLGESMEQSGEREEALKAYLECLGYNDKCPQLHRKIAALGRDLGYLQLGIQCKPNVA